MAQSLVVVRSLGVAAYGLVGLMGGLQAVAANALDVRLADACSRLYFAATDDERGEDVARLEPLIGAVLVQCGLSAVVSLATLALLVWCLPFFSMEALPTVVLVVYAASEGFVVPVANLLAFSQRFSGRFVTLAACDVANAAARFVVIVTLVRLRPTATGLVYATGAAGLVTLTLFSARFAWLWLRPLAHQAHRPGPKASLRLYWDERKLLGAFSLTSYQNLLHRAADVLFVGAFSGETGAGLYKFARACTDTLYVFYDAGNKVLQPKLLRLLADGDLRQYRRMACAVVQRCALAVAALVLVEALLLDDVLTWTVGARFVAASSAVMILTVPLFFVFGLSLWTWPILLHRGEMRSFLLASFPAVLVGQYLVPAAAVLFAGRVDVAWFAAGYLLYYVLLYARLLPRVRRMAPQAVPTFGALVWSRA
jgi:O-antigen/teichoic acid export membrane protein